ncbi:MAG: methyltransferase [Raoultibacter sp.]
MGFLLLIPFFLIRFGLLAALNKEAIGRAAYFAPLQGGEKTAYYLYQVSNVAIIVCLFFLRVEVAPGPLFYSGVAVYALGVTALIAAIVNFATPSKSGLNTKGLYRFSRNPMYVAYFIFFLGCVLLTQSLVLLGIVLVFQISSHWIICSEERWCIEQFGDEYRQYIGKVRRYL